MTKLNWILVILGILGLIYVRFVEDKIFYDPFLAYFQHKVPFPKYDLMKLILSHLLRFILNISFSLLVIQNIFRKKEWTIQAGILMLGVFIITFPLYIYLIESRFSFGKLFTFYIRRFVIQPILLLILIPLFYYRKNLEGRL